MIEYRKSIMGMLPKEWQVTSIGAQFSVQLGKMLDSERNAGSEKPYIGNRAVQWGRIDLASISYVKLTKSDISRYRLVYGDLLVCEGGEVGRCAIWTSREIECYYQKALHRLRPLSDYDPKLALYILEFYSSNGFLRNFTTQTSIAHLPKDQFEKVPIILPPLHEQRAIAATLSDVDATIAKLDELFAKQLDIRQATVQRLLTGRQRLPGFTGIWNRLTMGSLFQFLKSGTNSRSELSQAGDALYVHYGDIHASSGVFLDLSQCNLSYIDLSKMAGLAELEHGDLILADASEDYEGIGKAVEIRKETHVNAVAGLHTILMRGRRDMLADGYKAYIQYLPSVKTALRRIANGISVYGISKASIKNIEIDIPPLEEQMAVAGILRDIEAQIEAVERRLSKTRDIKQGMMQELLTGRTRLI